MYGLNQRRRLMVASFYLMGETVLYSGADRSRIFTPAHFTAALNFCNLPQYRTTYIAVHGICYFNIYRYQSLDRERERDRRRLKWNFRSANGSLVRHLLPLPHREKQSRSTWQGRRSPSPAFSARLVVNSMMGRPKGLRQYPIHWHHFGKRW